ncbi:LysR family transcriptional regulator [Burkholderia sp. Ax-1724]|nr:LysR family transcriptional regulator [Burkholderia sp. Ax-1724]NIF77327.1 LysR family transcriptional regulator [Paraburkholderia sp. Cy-641]
MLAMNDIDLKLLQIFDEIYTGGSVSRAAEKLALSQPTLSVGLSKLRRRFNDPLFVRGAGGMRPTPHAEALIEPIREVLRLLQYTLSLQAVFDPMSSARVFRIAMTDISQVVLLPQILAQVRVTAPNVRIETSHISADTPTQLETGEIDLTIGYMPHIEAGFYQQKLFDDHVVCLLRTGHPRIGPRLTLKSYLSEAHLEVQVTGSGFVAVTKMLETEAPQRRVHLRIPSYLGIGEILAGSDLLATVPHLLADVLQRRNALRALPVPIGLPCFTIRQYWHARFHHNPACRWIRQTVGDLFNGLGSSVTPEHPVGEEQS